MTMYNRYTIINGKPRWIIVDENGNIINESPTKEELKSLEVEPHKIKRKGQSWTKKRIIEVIIQSYEETGRVPTEDDFKHNPNLPSDYTVYKYFGYLGNAIKEAGLLEKRYNPTHSCDRCRKNFNEVERLGKTPVREYDDKGNWTRKWDCPACWEKYSSNSKTNIMKSIGDRRTGNLDPNSPSAKGDKGEELLCRWKRYTNLNKKHDNYTIRRDCLDEDIGLYYQAKIASYDHTYKRWPHDFRNLQNSIWLGFRFKSLFLFCISEDGKRIERIYEIPEEEVIKGSGISIVKYRTSGLLYKNGWYEQYMFKDEEELKKVNEIWQRIINEN